MAAGEVELWAEVGAGGSGSGIDGQLSRVRLYGTIWHQYRTIIAPGGLGGGSRAGSAGYSGGGGYDNNANGGSNGNDGGQGNSYAGGSGTWEDITAYQMSEFTLSPGQGGQPYDNYYGGGGGGVLVGGLGPSRSQHKGEGYGGGGGYDGSNYNGLPGVILVEVV